MIVRLKEINIVEHCVEYTRFNSMIVRLKETRLCRRLGKTSVSIL